MSQVGWRQERLVEEQRLDHPRAARRRLLQEEVCLPSRPQVDNSARFGKVV